jgi:hypothetical protein
VFAMVEEGSYLPTSDSPYWNGVFLDGLL